MVMMVMMMKCRILLFPVDSKRCLCTGVLLDDLLVAEDLAAAETTNAALHAAAAAAANSPAGRSPGRCLFMDERTRQGVPDANGDGAVVLGSPVAPPINGDMCTDISTENALLQGSR